jgi:hypothetical protein
MANSDLQQLQTQGDDLPNVVAEALRSAGLHDLEIGSIRLNVRKQGLVCPPKKRRFGSG